MWVFAPPPVALVTRITLFESTFEVRFCWNNRLIDPGGDPEGPRYHRVVLKRGMDWRHIHIDVSDWVDTFQREPAVTRYRQRRRGRSGLENMERARLRPARDEQAFQCEDLRPDHEQVFTIDFNICLQWEMHHAIYAHYDGTFSSKMTDR